MKLRDFANCKKTKDYPLEVWYDGKKDSKDGVVFITNLFGTDNYYKIMTEIYDTIPNTIYGCEKYSEIISTENQEIYISFEGANLKKFYNNEVEVNVVFKIQGSSNEDFCTVWVEYDGAVDETTWLID